jgi:hypothetical protein
VLASALLKKAITSEDHASLMTKWRHLSDEKDLDSAIVMSAPVT